MKKTIVLIVLILAVAALGIFAFIRKADREVVIEPSVEPVEPEKEITEELKPEEIPQAERLKPSEEKPEPKEEIPKPVPKKEIDLEKIKETKREIKTEVEETTVYYQKESFYSPEDFSGILENKEKFETNLIEKFRTSVSKYKEKISNIKVEFNSEKNSAILAADVDGAISKTESKYYATFEWLIYPLGLDFINDHFKETKEGLFWEGKVEEVSLKISCYFPFTGAPYKGWAHPTGHCHAHVWWTE